MVLGLRWVGGRRGLGFASSTTMNFLRFLWGLKSSSFELESSSEGMIVGEVRSNVRCFCSSRVFSLLLGREKKLSRLN